MKGKAFEEKVTQYMKGYHKGEPGEPDYTRGPVQGEVKDWDKRMGKSDIMEEIGKGRSEITSRKGFTDEAVEYKNRYQPKVKLFDWSKKKFT